MDFELGEEQVMLKTSARDFLEKECPKQLVRDMMEDERGYSPELWRKMAEQGWMGLAFPEEYGGAGMTFLDLAVLLEEMGRALVPGPFVPTVVLAGLAILAAGTEEQKQQFLTKIANGDILMTLASLESSGGLEASDITVKATPDGDNFIIDGTKLFVPDAHVADYLLCVARTKDGPNKEEGITLFLVDTTTAGIRTEVLKTMTGVIPGDIIAQDIIYTVVIVVTVNGAVGDIPAEAIPRPGIFIGEVAVNVVLIGSNVNASGVWVSIIMHNIVPHRVKRRVFLNIDGFCYIIDFVAFDKVVRTCVRPVVIFIALFWCRSNVDTFAISCKTCGPDDVVLDCITPGKITQADAFIIDVMDKIVLDDDPGGAFYPDSLFDIPELESLHNVVRVNQPDCVQTAFITIKDWPDASIFRLDGDRCQGSTRTQRLVGFMISPCG